MWYSVSDTAEYGGYVVGDQIESDIKEYHAEVLHNIQDGSFAEQWVKEFKSGSPNFKARRGREHDLLIEEVGANLRDMMPFVNPKHVKQSE
jgi:ketol-acid reductoisomerase